MSKTVLQILPSLRSGGVERGTIEMTAAIAKAGWTPIVVSSGGPLVPQISYVGGKHIALPVHSKNPFLMWQNVFALEKIIREHKVDIVHARSRAPAWSAYFAARRKRVPFLTTFHGIYGLDPFIKRYYNSIMTRGERIIAVSNFVAEHLRNQYFVPELRIRTIHRGVDANIFDPMKTAPQRIATLVNDWRLPDDLPIILMPGRFSRWKGQEIAIQALGLLPHRKFYCVVVGDDVGHPEYKKELGALAASMGLEGHLLITGGTPYMPEAYMLSSLVLCPSTEPEAFGRVPVEAQAMGKPVIASAHGGACETIIDKETGWLVKPGSIEELRDAIDGILSLSEDERNYVGERAMRHVREHFTTERMCQKTLAVYQELLDGTSP